MSEPWTPGPWKLIPHARTGTFFVNGPPWWPDRDGVYFYEADARLISLAPEMAELLGRCVEYDYSDSPSWIAEARALLARARG